MALALAIDMVSLHLVARKLRGGVDDTGPMIRDYVWSVGSQTFTPPSPKCVW